MKTRTFTTMARVSEFIETTCNAYSVIMESPLISKDGETSVKHLRSVHENHMVCDGKEVPTFDYAPYTFWIGVRTRGVESSESRHHVISRIMDLNDKALCAIKIEYSEGTFTVSYKKRSIEF